MQPSATLPRGGRPKFEAPLLSTVQQCREHVWVQVRMVEKQVKKVGCRDAVKGLGAGAEVQSSLKDNAHPLLDLTP
ncbi:hypothetical protein EYF80_023287 [Liparis tanakae]|uniref:Uncharacterized protein n=1 Tax=Liparis tanakae TaxID=230148 RepID=A0A4Z2HNG4_9TELE|nr:hypothetical protein EYF80_023287 [Liparis tanakae]